MHDEATFPSGEPAGALDVSLFEARPRRSAPTEVCALHVCPCCESELVHPVDWAPVQRERWNVDLRCPDCEWRGGGVYPQDVVDRFDEELDAGCEQLLGDLRALTRANMEEQIAAFVRALGADQILPEDF